MIDQRPWVIDVVDASYVGGYKLHLRFSDGRENEVDFEPFLTRSLNPMIRAYLDPDLFQRFSIEHGGLVWNEYDLCFPVADLYEGRV